MSVVFRHSGLWRSNVDESRSGLWYAAVFQSLQHKKKAKQKAEMNATQCHIGCHMAATWLPVPPSHQVQHGTGEVRENPCIVQYRAIKSVSNRNQKVSILNVLPTLTGNLRYGDVQHGVE